MQLKEKCCRHRPASNTGSDCKGSCLVHTAAGRVLGIKVRGEMEDEMAQAV